MSSSASVKLRYEKCLQVWGNAMQTLFHQHHSTSNILLSPVPLNSNLNYDHSTFLKLLISTQQEVTGFTHCQNALDETPNKAHAPVQSIGEKAPY